MAFRHFGYNSEAATVESYSGHRWVIGRTGVIKCMYQHTFYDPCPSDHPPTPPSTMVLVQAWLSIVRVSAPLSFGISACGSQDSTSCKHKLRQEVMERLFRLTSQRYPCLFRIINSNPCSRGMMINSSVDKRSRHPTQTPVRRSTRVQEVGLRAYLRRIAEAQRNPVIPR